MEASDHTTSSLSVPPPVLSPASVVGRLRAAVCAPDGEIDDAARTAAARELARLANNLAAQDLTLSDDVVAGIEAIHEAHPNPSP